jgi:Glycosyl transferase family 11
VCLNINDLKRPFKRSLMIIITSKFGQLANRLFIFAHFIAFAVEHNVTLLNPAFEEYAQFFESTYSTLLCPYPTSVGRLPISQRMRNAAYEFFRALAFGVQKTQISNPIVDVMRLTENQECDLSGVDFLNLVNQKKVVLAKGWLFRDRSNWSKHTDKIRAYFTPIEPHRSRVQALISSIRPRGQILVGVHVRQGDYAEFMGGQYFYTAAQYVQVMEKIKVLFSDQEITFLICSNVPQKPEDFSPLNVAFATNHLIEDLYALAQCDYLIGTLSTYTLWASFYGEVPLYTIQDPDRSIALSDFSVCVG